MIKITKRVAKQKFKLTEQPFEFNFTVLAIASQSSDYHLCWHVNRELRITLSRKNDLQIDDAKKKRINYFSFFSFTDTTDTGNYYFIANKSGGDYFLPEVKMADFLLVIPGTSASEIKKVISLIKKLPQVMAITELELNKLKSKGNLIFE